MQAPVSSTSPDPAPDFEELGVPPSCSAYTSTGSGWSQNFYVNDGAAPYNYHSFTLALPQSTDLHLEPYSANSAGSKTVAAPLYYSYFYRPTLTLSGMPEDGGAATAVYVNATAFQGLVYRNDLKTWELRVQNESNNYRSITGGVASGTIVAGASMKALSTRRFSPGEIVKLEAYLKRNVTYRDEMVLANYQGQGNLPKKWFKVAMPYQDLVVKVTSLTDSGTPVYLSVPLRGFTDAPDVDHRVRFRNELYYAAPYDATSGTTLAAGSSGFYTWLDGRKDHLLNLMVMDQLIGKVTVDANNNPSLPVEVRRMADWGIGMPSGSNALNCVSKTASVYRSQTMVDHIMPAATQGVASLKTAKLSGPVLNQVKVRTITSRDSLVPPVKTAATLVLKNTGSQPLTYDWDRMSDLSVSNGGLSQVVPPGGSHTLTLTADCPLDPLTGRPVVGVFFQKFRVVTNDPGISGRPETAVEFNCGTTTLYGWSDATRTFVNVDYPASTVASGASPSANPLADFKAKLTPDLVYSNVREVNPPAARNHCQSSITRANDATRCYWADVEPNPIYTEPNRLAVSCAERLITATQIWQIDFGGPGYPAASALYGDSQKASEYTTGVCNTSNLVITGDAVPSGSFLYTVKHVQGNTTYTASTSGIEPNPFSFNFKAANCATALQMGATIWSIDVGGPGYPAASELYGDSIKAERFSTGPCNNPDLTITGNAVTSGTYTYTVKHRLGSTTYTLTEEGISPRPRAITPDEIAYSCVQRLNQAIRTWEVDYGFNEGYPAVSYFYADGNTSWMYQARACQNSTLVLGGAAVPAHTSYQYTVKHVQGATTFNLSQTGIYPPAPFAQSWHYDHPSSNCAWNLKNAAELWKLEHPTTSGYPTVQTFYGDRARNEKYGTYDCEYPGLKIAGAAVTSGSFQYTVSHQLGSKVYTVRESGVTSSPL
ncbi:hypothetical protein DC3_49350 [Deinococcus cellulosilyticus NBRC 106333 = KACC 11606]|uniref:Uncharacterized protein n=1 Tax=Deinococcus cellulosilyticus (strain DSM 18568 / NBRC 106333 / KACC 11606 / 5516J-15) TaxID=1223518 RepID=A0A511N940_DEIC1|nr:hypothetical protein DC3_49350 [Deinococcus cellulosilyticus NBRC 106333 = KACC 11606]